MKEKRDCKIVQDLLPNYIENLTNEETNRFIEEHLKECPECQKVLENMQKEIKVSTTKRDDREVKCIINYNINICNSCRKKNNYNVFAFWKGN